MVLRDITVLDYIRDEDYDSVYKKIDNVCSKHEVTENQAKFLINAILFSDCDICLEYLIAEYKSIFLIHLDYIQDKAMNVYFSDKCLNLLIELPKREDLFI